MTDLAQRLILSHKMINDVPWVPTFSELCLLKLDIGTVLRIPELVFDGAGCKIEQFWRVGLLLNLKKEKKKSLCTELI